MAVQSTQHDAASPVAVRRHRFTVADFYRMGEVGLLAPDVRIELIDGELFEMPPIGPGHAGCVEEFVDILRARLPNTVLVRSQNPLSLGLRTEPEPDLAVVARSTDFYRRRHPAAHDVLLVIEVSDTTLVYDRDVKGPLYARAGIPEYWIVNLVDAQVIVHREPKDGLYATVTTHAAGDALQPLAFPDVTVAVADILG